MISNLVSQLKEQDALNRMDEVLAEIPQVRKDLGYPPLVTPTSKIVGSQAVFNVLIDGKRYRNVTKEVKDYVRGYYGRTPAPVSDEIRKMIIGDEEVITVRPADLLEPAYAKMKEEAEKAGLIKKEEDILTYILYPAIAPAFLKGEKTGEEIPRKQPVATPAPEIPNQMEVEVDGEVFSIRIISVGGSRVEGTAATPQQKIPRGDVAGGIKSNMQGMVLKVMVSRGAPVKKGDVVVVLEAMKMENPIHSPIDGKVTEIFVDTGDVVSSGDVLLVVQ
jgi:pyruvate carboxylase subunit B